MQARLAVACHQLGCRAGSLRAASPAELALRRTLGGVLPVPVALGELTVGLDGAVEEGGVLRRGLQARSRGLHVGLAARVLLATHRLGRRRQQHLGRGDLTGSKRMKQAGKQGLSV